MARKFLDYRKRPDEADFDSRLRDTEERMWWEAAHRRVAELDGSACPAASSFLVKTGDFWNMGTLEELEDSPVNAYVAFCPDFMKIISCGYYDRLFERYDMGEFEYRKKHPRKWRREWLAPRRSAIEGDLMDMWHAATTASDKTIPMSRCESPEDMARMLKRTRRELDITEMVANYVKGIPVEAIVKARISGLRVDDVAESLSAGVPEDDIFA